MGEKSAPEGRGLVPTIKPPLSRPPTSLSSGGGRPQRPCTLLAFPRVVWRCLSDRPCHPGTFIVPEVRDFQPAPILPLAVWKLSWTCLRTWLCKFGFCGFVGFFLFSEF